MSTKRNILKRVGALALALVLLGAAAMVVGAAGQDAKAEKSATLPQKAAPKTGVTVYSNEKASVDASNLSEGYLMVKYTGGKNVRIKVQITKSGGVTYTYDLNNAGNVETFPLTEGDGTYTVKVFENTSGTKYAQAFSTWVVDNFTYDYDKAATVQSGYLPVVDTVLATKKGICFDYAAVMTAMLRSQNIPCKLVVGYAGETYHAWINVYVDGVGWIDKAIYFDGQNWTLMDPTFTSTGNRSQSIMQYVTDSTNYTQKYAY